MSKDKTLEKTYIHKLTHLPYILDSNLDGGEYELNINVDGELKYPNDNSYIYRVDIFEDKVKVYNYPHNNGSVIVDEEGNVVENIDEYMPIEIPIVEKHIQYYYKTKKMPLFWKLTKKHEDLEVKNSFVINIYTIWDTNE